MFVVSVEHTNPSRDNEYTKVEECVGYIVLAFNSGTVSVLADGMRPDADTIRKLLTGEHDGQQL